MQIPQPIWMNSRPHLSRAARKFLGKLEQAQATGDEKPSGSAGIKFSRQTMQRITAYVQANLSGAIRVEDIARHIGMSRAQFMRRFVATTGVTPHKFITGIRMGSAKTLLAGGKLNLAQIAEHTGFANQSHFSAAFRKSEKSTPLSYRKQNTGNYPQQEIGRPATPKQEEFGIHQTSLWISDKVRVLNSSAGLGWRNIFAAQTEETPYEGLRVPVSAVWLVTTGCQYNIRRLDDKNRYDKYLPKHVTSILAAEEKVYDEIRTPLTAQHVFIRSEVLCEVADEIFRDSSERRFIASSLGYDDLVLYQLVQQITATLGESGTDSQVRADYLTQVLAVYLLTHHSVVGTAPPSFSAQGFNTHEVSMVRDYVTEHLSSHISVDDICRMMGLSRTSFYQKCRATTTMTPYQYLAMRRVNRARQLLTEPVIDYAQIALACGFADQSHFISTFRRHIGVTPGQYREIMN
ncbi:MAG: AraC family transcriptional regulator [Gemmobacter sp.]|nr:AraC family transcriptional regulator [Gemmobacter sp.]